MGVRNATEARVASSLSNQRMEIEMGLRSRLKNRIKSLAGAEQAPQSAPVQPPTQPPVAAPKPVPPPVVQPEPKPVAAAPTPATTDTTGVPAPKPISEEKVARHFEKTRRGVLKFVIDQGGSASLSAMHDFSERRYFVAHKKFSDVMEGFVDNGLVNFDSSEGIAHITESGRAYLES